jgi:B12 binding domain/Radical SAM superfamily
MGLLSIARCCKVLLIDPPLYKHPFWDPIRTSQPLGIWSIGSYLQARGHEVRMICAPLQGLDRVEVLGMGRVLTLSRLLEDRACTIETASTDSLIDRWFNETTLLRVGLSDNEILAEIDAFKPDLVGIASLASCMHQSFVALARRIRAEYPAIPIIAGGQHATAMPFELLRDAAGAIDLVVLGEGELVAAEIVARLPNLSSAKALEGVAYLDENGWLVRNKRPKWADLSLLAPLDPGLMAHVPLPPVPVHTFGSTPKRFTDIMFSVGCHRGCPYCFSPVMRGKLRQLSEDRIARQLRMLREAGYDELVLQDDDLLKNKEFFLNLLRLIREHGLSWQDNGGMELELLDHELVDAIVASGCTSIYIPVNPRQLADRLPTAAAIANVGFLKRLRDAGIYTFTSGIYGVPNLERPSETYDDLLRLRDFHLRLVTQGYVDASLVFPLSALPGTPWFRAVDGSPDFEFDREQWIGYSIFVPQVYPKVLGKRRLLYEIIETHRALNEIQETYPWFSAFPNRLSWTSTVSSGQANHSLEGVA